MRKKRGFNQTDHAHRRYWEHSPDPLQPSPEEELISKEEKANDPVQSDEDEEETPDAPEEFPPDLYARLVARFGRAYDAWKKDYDGAGLNNNETIVTLLEKAKFKRPDIALITGWDRVYLRKQFSRAWKKGTMLRLRKALKKAREAIAKRKGEAS